MSRRADGGGKDPRNPSAVARTAAAARLRRARSIVQGLALGQLLCLTLACTIIRHVGPEDGGAGPGPSAPPRVFDVLFIVDLDPSTANLASSYHTLIELWSAAIEMAGIDIRQAAIAPLHRRIGGEVPLLPLEDSGAFATLEQYTSGERAPLLTDPGLGDFDNLLWLGERLDHIGSYEGGALGRAYFEPPADGFVVILVAPLAARCAGGCEAEADAAAEHLTRTDDAGQLTWLDLPSDEGLRPSQVHLVLISTPEVGSDFSAMADTCRRYPNFPLDVLDFLEPTAPLFSQTASRVAARGARAHRHDLCGLLSSNGPNAIDSTAATFR